MALTGLNYPADLDSWKAWQRGKQGIRARVRHQLARLPWHGRPPIRITATGGSGCDLLIAMDATTATSILALLRPVEHLRGISIRIATPGSIADIVPAGEWREGHADIDAVTVLATRATVVLSSGHFLPLGAAAYRGARKATFFTVQHGLIAPQAPPLAPNTHLLAWSQADADFWRSGRTDVAATVVGSQLLWEAAQKHIADPPAPTDRPIYLGQLHGAELDRAELAASTERFCRQTHAIYRPHPSEHDRRSRAQHRKWAAQGIEIDSGATPLADLNTPIVSAFSTGILEAAAKGLPAWAYHANPPEWLAEFWQRYGMHQWGDSPTPAPPRPDIEPAEAIANAVMEAIGTAR